MTDSGSFQAPGEGVHLTELSSFASLLRGDAFPKSNAWLPLLLTSGAIAAVAYADHRITSLSLIYLYIFPLSLAAMFLHKELSYGLIVFCIVLHYFDSPRRIPLELRIFHDVSAFACFVFIVYVIQRYVAQRETLLKAIRIQRDDLVRDVELAAQVQRLFLPVERPAIAGIEIAGMMRPARGVGGDYYDYIPIDDKRIQIVVADVAGKGIPAALLMSATAAAVQLETNRERSMLETVRRLNAAIHPVSNDGIRYVTMILAEMDVKERKLRFMNCGHNPALLLRSRTSSILHMDSSCPPVGMFAEESCDIGSVELEHGDVLVFYTDGVTEAENTVGEEFGVERLSSVLRKGARQPAEQIMEDIFKSSASFSKEIGFGDDVTILVAKCNFGNSTSEIL